MSVRIDLPDEVLVQEFLEQDRGLLCDLLKQRYGNIIFHKCEGFSENFNCAKQLTQEVMAELCKRLPDYPSEGRFATWMYTEVYNQAAEYLRLRYYETL